jgi:hypothetical protein
MANDSLCLVLCVFLIHKINANVFWRQTTKEGKHGKSAELCALVDLFCRRCFVFVESSRME